MIVNIIHTDMPRFKNSELLGIAGTVTNTLYQVVTGMGFGMDALAIQALYVASVATNTGSSIFEKWEKHNANKSTEE